jgi:glycolate oxidase FAD binding subunit
VNRRHDYATSLGTEPAEVARPSSPDEVAARVARAAERGEAVIPWGGGTGQDYGYLPRRADVVLDLGGLDRVLAHEPGDLTVTVEAGATLASVQDALAAHRQFLPLDPPDAGRATIGGILATNAWGPSRLGHGTARDWLIGLAVVDARGRIVRGGGKVVKNVTGYDLPKLHVGALGTLGVIVEATFKVAPLPEATRAILCPLASDGDAAAFLTQLHAETSPTLSLLRDAAPASRWACAAFCGPTEVVDSEIARAVALAAAYGLPEPTVLSEGVANPFGGGRADADAALATLHLRVGGDAGAAAYARHEALAGVAPWEHLSTLPGTGHSDAVLPTGAAADAATAARAAGEWARRNGVPLTWLHAPAALRGGSGGEEADLWSPAPAAFPLMRRMKETLDPAGTLNPGRFVGRL